jgi:hypothetical protein
LNLHPAQLNDMMALSPRQRSLLGLARSAIRAARNPARG